jgi:hypothetical protein
MAAGVNFLLQDGSIVRSANITPDDETGIGKWTEDCLFRSLKCMPTPPTCRKKLRQVSLTAGCPGPCMHGWIAMTWSQSFII